MGRVTSLKLVNTVCVSEGPEPRSVLWDVSFSSHLLLHLLCVGLETLFVRPKSSKPTHGVSDQS